MGRFSGNWVVFGSFPRTLTLGQSSQNPNGHFLQCHISAAKTSNPAKMAMWVDEYPNYASLKRESLSQLSFSNHAHSKTRTRHIFKLHRMVVTFLPITPIYWIQSPPNLLWRKRGHPWSYPSESRFHPNFRLTIPCVFVNWVQKRTLQMSSRKHLIRSILTCWFQILHLFLLSVLCFRAMAGNRSP